VVIERRVAVVLLLDRAGRILMQHRDANARTSPNQWTFPGGQIEPGEEPHDAARRELWEETGLREDGIVPLGVFYRPSVFDNGNEVEIHAYCGTTEATQDDVVLGEGQAMVFVTIDEATAKDLGVTAALILPVFLGSEQYSELRLRH
jgi:8-oxo-dGTP diphosphatase